MNLKKLFFFGSASLCAGAVITSTFNLATVGAQTKRPAVIEQAGGSPVVSASLADSFTDADSNGRAAAGEEVTLTAVITNNGGSDAQNVVYTNLVDSNSALVPGSVQVHGDASAHVIRCDFNTDVFESAGCWRTSSAYGSTDINNYTILGGQGSRLSISSLNQAYDAGSGVFSFDATVQNLIAQSLGTIDGSHLDASGVQLFVHSARVVSGTGNVTAVNANGTGTFTAPGQPYFQYNEILAPNATSSVKNLQFNVPNTVGTFRVDFLVYTKAQAKIVINEVLANPGGTISDANGEWFEVVNLGLFPVELKNFYIGDSSASGDRPVHQISPVSGSLVIQPSGYLVFGNTTNTTNNGGVPVNYPYGAALALANSLDALRFISPVYDPPVPPSITPVYTEIDRAGYLTAAISAQNGISRELKDPALNNLDIDGANWQDALVTSVYGPAGRGTPGAANTGTPQLPLANVLTSPESGETVTANVGTITAGGRLAIVTYRVTVADPIPAGSFSLINQGTVSGSNFASVTTDDPGTGTAGDTTRTPIGSVAPTAADVAISGRVISRDGRGLANVRVFLFGQDGEPRLALTNPFGYYRFEDLTAGSTYVAVARHKRYAFETRMISPGDDVTGLDFTAIQ